MGELSYRIPVRILQRKYPATDRYSSQLTRDSSQ
jgi:hypothetical protein